MKRESMKLFAIGLIPHLVRLVLGGLFIAAGYVKIVDPAGFAKMIYNYQMLPDASINLLAIFLPWLEVVGGGALILAPRFREAASLLIGGMLVVFTTAVISAYLRGLNISCGCFSVDPEASSIGLKKIAENTAMLGATAYCWWEARRHPSVRKR